MENDSEARKNERKKKLASALKRKSKKARNTKNIRSWIIPSARKC